MTKISEQLKYIRDSLKAWGDGQGVGVFIASDYVDLFTQLRTKPGAARASVMLEEETKRGEHEEASMVDRKYWVVVSRGRSMKLNPADDLVETSAGGPALFDLVEGARQAIRNLEFGDGTENAPNYLKCYRFQLDGWALDAYILEFLIGTVMPDPQSTDED